MNPIPEYIEVTRYNLKGARGYIIPNRAKYNKVFCRVFYKVNKRNIERNVMLKSDEFKYISNQGECKNE